MEINSCRLCYFRNFFPDNLAQACFQHVKTNYDDVQVKKKRIEYITTPLLNTTLQLNTTTGVPVNVTLSPDGNVTKQIMVYYETVTVRSLKYGNGINVLGELSFRFLFSRLYSGVCSLHTNFYSDGCPLGRLDRKI